MRDYEKIVRDFIQPGMKYTAIEIASLTHCAAANIRPVLWHLVASGVLDTEPAGKNNSLFYFIPGSLVEQEVTKATKPYPRLQLSGTLTGYEESLTSHMRLCMETRK